MTNSALHSRGRGLELFCDRRVNDLCHRIYGFRIGDCKHDGTSDIMISFDMRGDPDLKNCFRHLLFKIVFFKNMALLLPGNGLRYGKDLFSFRNGAYLTYPLRKDRIVHGLYKIIRSTESHHFFDHHFVYGRRSGNKSRATGKRDL